MNMLEDNIIGAAVSNISQRAERTDGSKIVDTYVEVGILQQVLNRNNQIVYGRRGTGKTHLFKYLESQIAKQHNAITVYIDCRTLGSSSSFNDDSLDLGTKSLSLFRDILKEFQDSSLSYIQKHAPQKSNEALEILNNIIRSAKNKVSIIEEQEIILKTSSIHDNTSKIDASVSTNKLSFGIENGSHKTNKINETKKFHTLEKEKIFIPEFHHILKDFCHTLDIQVYFLIDEWSSLPLELQPLLSEFFKRSFLPISKVSLKIAALEYRSNFAINKEKNTFVGFELGSDISTSLDLDDYFVFDRNPERITDIFAEILYKHVNSEITNENYLFSEYKIKNGSDFIKNILADKNNFIELVRASEGVIRDMINIFTQAFFGSKRKSKRKIDKISIIESAQQWFESDKSQNLDEKLQQTLRKIVDEVIGKKKARSFLIPKELEKHENIQRLFDARVIHTIKRGYADKDNPGIRYSVFTLDYGTYVDLLTTNKKPEGFSETNQEQNQNEFIVPFDDKRSIRRIILSKKILD